MKKIYHLFIEGENPDEVLEKIEKLIQENGYEFYNADIGLIN